MFTLLHTNDFHDKLTRLQAEKLKALRLGVSPNGILLDAGDACGSGNINFRLGGEPIFDLMNEAGYSAMTVGNRDFHFSRIGLRSKLFRAKFPILCANIRLTRNSDQIDEVLTSGITGLPVQPYLIYSAFPQWRIAILGLTVPMITERMLSRKVSAFVFDDPIPSARTVIAHIHQSERFNLLVALTHIGIQQDRALAAAIPEIDLIIGGHTHVVLPEGERVGSTLIVQGGARGKFVGRVEVEERLHLDQPAQMRASLEPL